MRTLVAMAVVAGLAAPALGNEIKAYTGPGGSLVDFSGGVNGVARFEIFVPDHGIIKSFQSVSLLGFNHTWAGDLSIVLVHKDNGVSVTLLDRPGVPQSTFGDSADFNGQSTGPYNWADGGFVYDTDFFGATVTNHNLGPIPPSALSQFVGKDKYGVWSLIITDFAAGDTGKIQGWTITIQNVPGPATLAALALLGYRRRRR
jgi:hypothetical protein